jgi:hypothetical protein
VFSWSGWPSRKAVANHDRTVDGADNAMRTDRTFHVLCPSVRMRPNHPSARTKRTFWTFWPAKLLISLEVKVSELSRGVVAMRQPPPPEAGLPERMMFRIEERLINHVKER